MGIKCPKCQTDNPNTLKFCGECGTQLIPTEEISAPTETLEAAKEELTRGTTFASRYEIIEELGKGGMGKVYRVEDKKIKEEVALKLIKPEIASDKKTIERFSNELKMARKIAHRNVCKMYDLGEEKGTHYITMEYVPGEDLKGSIRRMGPLGAGKTIFIAKQVCEGLSEAHRLGVVHRDLKPQNIMIDKDGNARIMDFGIARSIAGKGITGAGVMIGTPEYMSPEQAEVKEVDQRSDIYSLGVILYEMVTGRVPFEGETPLGIAMKHKSEMPKDPKELNAQVTDDISRVILKCLEKNKEKRYQSTGEVRAELINIEKGIPTTEIEVPKRKPLTSREITVTFGLKKLFIPALVVIALIIAAVIIWQLLPQKEAVPLAPSGKPSLAVMYFENNTGDESLDHLRKALSDLLITDLSQSKYLTVIRGDRLFNILSQLNQLEAKSYSSDVLKEVAARGRASHILQGNYTKAGENFRINIMLHEANTEKLIGSEMVEGKGEESVFSMVDELTKRIKGHFKLSEEKIANDIDKNIGTITTGSLEAYKYYSEGCKYHDMGEFRQSIQFFKKAVAVDPEFATAYRSMAIAYSNIGYMSEREKYLQKALELSDRVSDRERYRIQAEFYSSTEKTWDKAIAAFNKLLRFYPDDHGGNTNLGALYAYLEQWDKAMERFEVNIQNKSELFYSYFMEAEVYMAKGLYEKARGVLDYYLNNISDHPMIHLQLALYWLCQGKYDLALVEVDKALAIIPSFYYIATKGSIYQCKGDLVEAEREYQKLLKKEEKAAHGAGRGALGYLYLLQGRFEQSKIQIKKGIELANKLGEEWKSDFHLDLAYLYLKSGNQKEALKECDRAWNSAVEAESLSVQKRALHLKGLTYLKMKAIAEAQQTADELKGMIEKGLNKKEIRYFHHLMGMMEFKRENYSKAIDYFKKAIALLPFQHGEESDHALFFDSLAFAYYRVRDLEKAKKEYEKIISLTLGRTAYGDIYARSFYMLGKIYEQKGWKGKDIEHYQKFLNLWKDADPGIAEVENAKKSVAALKSQ